MIPLKTDKEILLMQEGGKILGEVLTKTLEKVTVGISLTELDSFAEKEIIKKGAYPSFRMVPKYKWTLCCSVNDIVVHGIPDNYLLKKDDIIGIDCGVYYKGFHTDAAWSISLEEEKDNKNPEISQFLKTGRNALIRAIKSMKPGNYINDISAVIQETIETKRYSVVRSLVGHGIGRHLHEEPEIPGFKKEKRERTPKITAGMTMAIEVIYNMGNSGIKYEKDGWTIKTKDAKISGLFEATVGLTSHGCIVLTEIYDTRNI